VTDVAPTDDNSSCTRDRSLDHAVTSSKEQDRCQRRPSNVYSARDFVDAFLHSVDQDRSRDGQCLESQIGWVDRNELMNSREAAARMSAH
jgi:hypothetical protein